MQKVGTNDTFENGSDIIYDPGVHFSHHQIQLKNAKRTEKSQLVGTWCNCNNLLAHVLKIPITNVQVCINELNNGICISSEQALGPAKAFDFLHSNLLQHLAPELSSLEYMYSITVHDTWQTVILKGLTSSGAVLGNNVNSIELPFDVKQLVFTVHNGFEKLDEIEMSIVVNNQVHVPRVSGTSFFFDEFVYQGHLEWEKLYTMEMFGVDWSQYNFSMPFHVIKTVYKFTYCQSKGGTMQLFLNPGYSIAVNNMEYDISIVHVESKYLRVHGRNKQCKLEMYIFKTGQIQVTITQSQMNERLYAIDFSFLGKEEAAKRRLVNEFPLTDGIRIAKLSALLIGTKVATNEYQAHIKGNIDMTCHPMLVAHSRNHAQFILQAPVPGSIQLACDDSYFIVESIKFPESFWQFQIGKLPIELTNIAQHIWGFRRMFCSFSAWDMMQFLKVPIYTANSIDWNTVTFDNLLLDVQAGRFECDSHVTKVGTVKMSYSLNESKLVIYYGKQTCHSYVTVLPLHKNTFKCDVCFL